MIVLEKGQKFPPYVRIVVTCAWSADEAVRIFPEMTSVFAYSGLFRVKKGDIRLYSGVI